MLIFADSSKKSQESNMLTKYSPLKVYIVLLLLRKGKLTFSKVMNLLHCYVAYWLKLERSARTPFIINFDVSNHCDESCVFCRSEKGEIYDLNPIKVNNVIEKGTMNPDIFEGVLEQTQKTLLMAIPYVNGEPFIYSKLGRVLKFAKGRNVATMISSNGIMMTERNIDLIIDCDLDLIKVHVSGFTNDVHRIQHRIGDVEVIKENLVLLSRKIREVKAQMIVLVDYIQYKHNVHQIELMNEFSRKLGFLFSVRPGNPKGMEESEDLQPVTSRDTSQIACDWLWKALTVNWNGDVLPCCDYVVWSDAQGYGNFDRQSTDIIKMWNDETIVRMRRTHKTEGRKPIPICSDCKRVGIEYKF